MNNERIEDYLDEYGMVLDSEKKVSGNSWLLTGLAIATGIYDPELHVVDSWFKKCRKSEDCPLLYRHPSKRNADDGQNIDDMWGVFFIAHKYNHPWATEMLEYVEANDWRVNVQDPRSASPEFRFDRFPLFPPLLRMAAGKSLTVSDTITLFLGLLSHAFSLDKPDGNVKAFLRLKMCERESALYFPPMWLWERRVRKQHERIGLSWGKFVGYGHPLSTVAP